MSDDNNTGQADATPFDAFKDLARKLVAVPKKEVAEQERKYKKTRKSIRKRRRSKK